MNRLSKFSVLLFCLAAAGCQSTAKYDIKNTAKLLRASVIETNNAAPMMLDDETRLNSANAVGNKLNYLYTLVNTKVADVDVRQFVKVVTSQLMEATCLDNGMKTLVRHKVVVGYNYFDNEGNAIATIDVDTANCPANQ
ncbi:MAG: hypothetical protein HRT35_24010 [Algicola sp.]|nr:hypothetical protein [Algicola sp.]